MTGSTDAGTRQESCTNVVFGKKNAKITQLSENARSCHTGGRGSLQSMLGELGKENPHLQVTYGPCHPSCSMQSPGLSKGDALAAMWYPSNKRPTHGALGSRCADDSGAADLGRN